MDPESHEIPQADGAEFSDAFFSDNSLAPVESSWEPEPITKMARGAKRAMQATIGLLVLSLTGIGGYLFYAKVLMPTPVAVGSAVAQPPSFLAPPPVEEAELELAAVVPVETVVVETVVAEPDEAVAPMPVAAEALALAVGPQKVDPVAEVRTVQTPRVAPTKRVRTAHRRPRSAGSSLAKQAFARLNRGDFAAAERFAQRAVVGHPERAQGWIVLGAARDALGDKAGAKRAYKMCAAKALDVSVRHCRALAR